MNTTTAALTRLEEIAGREHLIGDPAQLAAYAVDGVVPAAAVRPASATEVAEIVKLAATEKLALIVAGARTKLGIGAPPSRYDVALDVTRMNRVLAYDPGDLTLGVEAGIGIAQLGGLLAEHKQFLPLAVPFIQQTTIGGTIASGVDSPLRQLCGTPRDFVLGMEFVTGEGIVSKSGGRVVKNVTGYDLHKLLIGSLGTLAIITRVNFRTFPLPFGSRALIAAFDAPLSAFDMRRRIASSTLSVSTLEIFNPVAGELIQSDAAATIAAQPIPPGLLPSSSWTLTTGFAGPEKVTERSEKELRAIADQAGATSVTVLSRDDVRAAFSRKREFVRIAQAAYPLAAILKISALPSRTMEILALAAKSSEAEALRCAVMTRGVGISYVALLPASGDDAALSRLARAVNQIMSACGDLGAHATVPWCPTALKRAVNVWGAPRADAELMQRIKKVFDPQGILAPGRFAGGI
jgi:glycolate oxidase FAD binding subunit